ncbi:hypothetical protein BK816_00095 [Boudabousia tangfeifanii]|uniref:non-specific serine/threonine protein kinase n=1 Tax=Boudabousia tangfeifanii TaxID=1912795 RepID=A0A1D9MI47_9ACTO|nr:serine/threonine-protein kinase [Boudabousia tangfeifanii]AOZ71883.1 hypothetical protein BK816_00095 [Boudabousia tangfeifanii]
MKIAEGKVYGDRYRLTSRIAVGGMGEVWRALDQKTHQTVAIKVLRDDLEGKAQLLERLAIEAVNASRMKHPNLAAVTDSGRDAETGWLVMELVEGRPLTDYLDDGRTLTVPQLLPILYQAALALTAVHAVGVVHRDIKPGNILVAHDGHVKLTDFGISRAEAQVDLTAAGMVMGTAQYLPPEQARGNAATPSGDLYSLGIIAYEALAGKRPFTGSTQVEIAVAHVNQKVPPLPEGIPPLVNTLVMSLLAKNPANRPPDAGAFARQVAYVARQLSVGIDPMPLPDPQPVRAATRLETSVEGISAPAGEMPPPPPAVQNGSEGATKPALTPARSQESVADQSTESTPDSATTPEAETTKKPRKSSRLQRFTQRRAQKAAALQAELASSEAETVVAEGAVGEAVAMAAAQVAGATEAIEDKIAKSDSSSPASVAESSPDLATGEAKPQARPETADQTQAATAVARDQVQAPSSASKAEPKVSENEPWEGPYGPSVPLEDWDKPANDFTAATAVPENLPEVEPAHSTTPQLSTGPRTLMDDAPLWSLVLLLVVLIVFSVLVNTLVLGSYFAASSTTGLEGSVWLIHNLGV